VRDPQRQTITIDRLVREILRGNLSEAEQRPYFELIAAALAETIPETPGKQRADLLEHASHIAKEATSRGTNFDITPERMLRIASYLCDHDKHDEALPLFRHGLEQREASMGNQHPTLLPFLKGLVRVAMFTGSLKAARDYSLRALKIRQTEKGNDAPELAADHEALGRIYEELHDDLAAVRHHAMAREIKNQRDDNSPSLELAAALHQLGVDYYHRKKYRNATCAFKEALDLRRRATYSQNAEQLATGYNNLALSCGMLALGERKLNHQEDASKNFQVAKQHFVRAMRLLEEDNATTESKMLQLLGNCERNLDWLKRSWGE
jgi:tetratricopeptide (TPR) repeat protein